MNEMLYKKPEIAKKVCSACLGSGKLHEFMVLKDCRICNGSKFVEDNGEQIVSEVIPHNVVTDVPAFKAKVIADSKQTDIPQKRGPGRPKLNV